MHTYILLFFYSLLTLSCANTKNSKNSANHAALISIDKNQNNSQTIKKYGFAFKIPNNWQIQLEDFKAKDLNGKIKSIKTIYQLSDKQGKVQIIYHPNKSGITLYNYYNQSKRKNLTHIKVNTIPAVKIINKLTVDGKGHNLKQPIIREKLYLLAPDNKGCLEIVVDYFEKNIKAPKVIDTFIHNITITQK